MHGEIDQPETTALAAANDASQAAAPRPGGSWMAETAVPVMWEFTAPPPERAAPIDPMALDAAHAQISALEARLERSEEENRAFIQTMRHVAAAAEELLAEARHDAATVRGAAEHEAHTVRTEMEQRLALAVGEAHREATRVLDEAHATAHELVVVARADAREIVHEERRRAADDLEMLAAVRERIAEERQSLARFHDQLSGRLRSLVEAMLDFADRGPVLDAGDAQFATTVLTGPQETRAIEPASFVEYLTEPAPPAPPSDRPVAAPDASDDSAPATEPGAERSPGAMHSTDEHLDRAFDAFFSDDVDHEPSRRWILED